MIYPATYMRTNFKQTVIYTGSTRNIYQRDWEHRNGLGGNFSNRYKTTFLVWYKHYKNFEEAYREELRIKAGSRRAKEKLISTFNPKWQDLGDELARSNPIASSWQLQAPLHNQRSSQ